MASIVDYLKSQGQASDYATRAKLAAEKGISGYTGTAEQNNKLLSVLQSPPVSAPTPAKGIVGKGTSQTVKVTKSDSGYSTTYEDRVGSDVKTGTFETAGNPSFDQIQTEVRSARGKSSGPSPAEIAAQVQKATEEEKKKQASADFYNKSPQTTQPSLPKPTIPDFTQRLAAGDFSFIPKQPKEAMKFLSENSPELGKTIETFRADNPGVDLNLEDPVLARQVQRELMRAAKAGDDPAIRLEKIFENERFQLAGSNQIDFPIQKKVETVDGPVDVVTDPEAKTVNDVIGTFLFQNPQTIMSEIQKDPGKFASMFSGDYVSQMLGASVLGATQDSIDLQKSLEQDRAMYENFSKQYQAQVEQEYEDNANIIDATKAVDELKTGLEEQKLQLEKEQTMAPLREKQARLESYLKTKLNVEGLTSSASGLSLLVSKVTAFDQMVEQTGMQYNMAIENLHAGFQERAISYTAQLLSNKRDADNKIFESNKALMENQSKVRNSLLLDSSERRANILQAIGNAMKEKEKIKEAQAAKEVEIWKETNRQQEKLLDESHKLAGLTGTIWSIDEDGELFDTGVMTNDQQKWQQNQMFDIGKYMISAGGIKGARQVELMMGLTHGVLGNDLDTINNTLDEIYSQAVLNDRSKGGGGGGGSGGYAGGPVGELSPTEQAMLDWVNSDEFEPSEVFAMDKGERAIYDKVVRYKAQEAQQGQVDMVDSIARDSESLSVNELKAKYDDPDSDESLVDQMIQAGVINPRKDRVTPTIFEKLLNPSSYQGASANA